MNTDRLKDALASAGSVILAMCGWWLVHLRNLPDREEVGAIVKTAVDSEGLQNPYLQDRSLLLHRLDSLTETTKDLDHAVRDLNGRLERLPGHQTKNGDVTAIAKP